MSCCQNEKDAKEQATREAEQKAANDFLSSFADKLKSNGPDTCPHCGYCPHCGRRNETQRYQRMIGANPSWSASDYSVARYTAKADTNTGRESF